MLLQLNRKTQPDIPVELRSHFRQFIQTSLSGKLHTLLSKKQVSRALREAGLSSNIVPGETLYIQWLCLFRCYAKFVLNKQW